MYACTYICANVSNTQEGVALYSNAQEGYAQKRATPIKERKCQSIDCKRERVGCSNDIGGFHEKFTPPPPLLHTNRERGIYQLQRELPHGTEIERKKISIQACIYIYIYADVSNAHEDYRVAKTHRMPQVARYCSRKSH